MSWSVAHIGFESDDVEIAGLKLWQHDWRSVDLEAIQLRHPTYPNQIHRYDIYEIGDPERPLRFAAGELSNGVWGFYVPT